MFKGELSRYTITIHELLENNVDLGLRDYPIFNEEYREVLNSAIIEHYRFREIGFHNPALFINRLNARMNLIMRDKYNDLYKAKATDFNPLFNVDMTETFTHEVDNTNQSNTNSSNTMNSNTSTSTSSDDENKTLNTGLNLNSSFPSEEMTEGDLSDNLFVDNANKQNADSKYTGTSNTESDSESVSTNDSTQSENSTGKLKETYTKKTQGSSAGLPFSKALIQLKDFYSKYDLDNQVIAELNDLFISLY